MKHSIRRPATFGMIFALALLSARAGASGDAKPGDAQGFPGTWSLLATEDDIAVKAKKGAWDVVPGAASRGGGGGGFDLPLEVMTDARRLVVEDDGTSLRVTYPSGRIRTFVTDEEKRYLDDGDGPATVSARRKGAEVTISSEWFRGYKLSETWELQTSPRRLVVTGRVRGRSSQRYVRTYEPAHPVEPAAPSAGAASTRSPAATYSPGTAPGAPIEAAPAEIDRLAECTIRPPRRSSPEELRALVRVSQEEAGKAAVASLSPLKPGDVISSDVESFEGCLVWPFTLRLPSKKGVQEVFVDAGDGKVVRTEFVPMGPAGGTPAP